MMIETTSRGLTWGQGARVLDVFLEPTCGHSGRAFGKLGSLLDEVGRDRLSMRITLQSQPWHLFSGVVCRAVLAAAATPGGKDAAWTVLETVYANRDDFVAEEHCRGKNMGVSPAAVLERLMSLTGLDLMAPFEAEATTRALKRHARYARQNGIHVSPTFMVDGLTNDAMSSRDAVSKWVEDLNLA